MKFRILFLLLLTITFFNCNSSATLAEIETLKKTVLDKNFTIIAEFANPVALMNVRGVEALLPPGSNLANISLINIDNNFTIKNDHISLDLPFYGERRFGGSYGTESGFQFEGIPEKVNSSFNPKKNTYEFEYWINAKDESLRISLALFVNKTCRFTVNSSLRSTITYTGKWKVPVKE